MEDRYNVECCDFIHAHEDVVEKVRRELPGHIEVQELCLLNGVSGEEDEVRWYLANQARKAAPVPSPNPARGR